MASIHNRLKVVAINMCWGLNSHWFPVVGDDHQTNSRDLHTDIPVTYPLLGFNMTKVG